jgi:GTP-binding protein
VAGAENPGRCRAGRPAQRRQVDLLSAVSRARPKIADYPFTTLEPMLGTVVIGHDSYTIADIPGLIEGASEGKGLGDRFLGHIERCAALIHLVDASQENPVAAWRTVRRELAGYGHGLTEKPETLCLSKTDAVPAEELALKRRKLKRAAKAEVHCLSAVAQQGLQPVLGMVLALVQERRAQAEAA